MVVFRDNHRQEQTILLAQDFARLANALIPIETVTPGLITQLFIRTERLS